ncbi:thiamine pyrophosphate-dependent enzyme [Desulfovibrio sp. JC022]|uniref:thiamine pyrophosphate-dependent enzyme n=1 Tax=Desulfovibrio sp. JC022 TaxID=2593642 RepID=UPI0013D0DCE7|nr:thiamine pyrophosphate-dependent enzyme [Desulfovibrio sp. JC022]NDV24110.1 2-oxoglutarate oxidoreductase [Desulfovibrio sp. JC022]
MSEQEILAFDKADAIVDVPTHYCPGCQHGVAHRLAGELLSEMGLTEDTLLVTSIGCSVFLYNYLNVDSVEAPHGRAPAVATGVKRARKDKFVLSYQGDGDLASIGMAEIMHIANRGEKVSIIFVNNTVYGMTGGQMAPTTMEGQKTTTSPNGRDPMKEGQAIRMAEIIAQLGGTAYSARVALNNVKNIRKAKKAMKKAFEVQQKGLGFGFIELLATCPTNWRMTPIQANERVESEMIPYFPLGVYKDATAED